MRTEKELLILLKNDISNKEIFEGYDDTDLISSIHRMKYLEIITEKEMRHLEDYLYKNNVISLLSRGDSFAKKLIPYKFRAKCRINWLNQQIETL
jgi:hypothetical protein